MCGERMLPPFQRLLSHFLACFKETEHTWDSYRLLCPTLCSSFPSNYQEVHFNHVWQTSQNSPIAFKSRILPGFVKTPFKEPNEWFTPAAKIQGYNFCQKSMVKYTQLTRRWKARDSIHPVIAALYLFEEMLIASGRTDFLSELLIQAYTDR